MESKKKLTVKQTERLELMKQKKLLIDIKLKKKLKIEQILGLVKRFKKQVTGIKKKLNKMNEDQLEEMYDKLNELNL